ncbi:hypothetical protein U9M48_010806 [Paspalum notatum var. saurae]|uniref:Uncharacterized protein n=1 Tax=Paspalum notatum var. saurae TaxID=547442 RepID=A0AAQ3WGP7_PASNO
MDEWRTLRGPLSLPWDLYVLIYRGVRPTTIADSAWSLVVWHGLGCQCYYEFSSIALQTRRLWLQRTDEHRVWSGLPIKVAAEVRAFFDASVVVQVGDGRRTLFWLDRWLGGKKLTDLAPALAATVPRHIARSLTVAEGLQGRLWVRGITGGQCRGQGDLEVVDERPILLQFGLQGFTPGFSRLSGKQTHLAILAAIEG